MFIGHYGVSLVAAARPRSPGLGTLFVAAQLIDIAFFSFLLIGIEHMRLVPGATASNAMDLYDLPYTHSLIGTLVWAAGFALLLRLAGLRWPAALIGAAVVVSHWLLDLLVHRPDLTIAGGPPRLGLGLWNMPLIEHAIELAFAYGAMLVFARATRGPQAPLLILAVLMAVLQAVNWTTPQPPAIVDPVPASVPLLGLFAYGLLAAAAWWAGAVRTHR